MGVAEAQKAVEKAKLAYSANADDKALKKALKAAKVELAVQIAAEAAAEPAGAKSSKKRKEVEVVARTPEETKKLRKEKKAKKAKRSEEEKKAAMNLDNLRTVLSNAKTAYKADKTIENKQKVKAAKKAVKAADLEAKTNASASTDAAAPAPPPPLVDSSDLEALSALKSNKTAATADQSKGPDNPPCNRVFVGNLSWDVNDELIKAFFADCGTVTAIAWIEDKNTQRFKGCGVLDFDSVESATKAVAKHQEMFMERAVVVQFSKPATKSTGGVSIDEKQKRFVDLPLSPKPEGCLTCFLGNLSYNIEESDVLKLAKDCGVEAVKVRWVMNKETGDFKGCGFVDFATTEDVDKFVANRGALLAGRPVRIDYAGAPPTRQ